MATNITHICSVDIEMFDGYDAIGRVPTASVDGSVGRSSEGAVSLQVRESFERMAVQ